jgi:glycosyltransferase involved in cell wall biosynthesis
MISPKSISNINRPLFWTMHDMWPFCGAEHFTNCKRFSEGYNIYNRKSNESGFDISRIIWNYKIKFFSKKNINIICPSQWIKDKADKSLIFKNHKKNIIPYIVDLKDWSILKKKKIQLKHLGTNSKKVIFFSATSSVDHRKGFNFLFDAINKYLDKEKYFLLAAGVKPKLFDKINIEKKFLGYITNQKSLNIAYNISDFLVLPSLAESFGQVYIEAGACGIPSVAFKNTAAQNIIIHKKNGYLAKFGSSKSLADGIKWIEKNLDKNILHKQLRHYISNNFSTKKNIAKLISLYKNSLRN